MNKKIIAILLAVALMLSLAACGGGKTSKKTGQDINYGDYNKDLFNEPGTFPIFKQKQTISLQIPQSVYVEDYDTNQETLLLEERLNAELVFETIPSKEYSTKINLMVAADGVDLADAIIGSFTDSVVNNYARNDAIQPLTEYFNNASIGYWLNDAKTRLGYDFTPLITMPDGNIYGIPSINEAISNVNLHKMYVYKPWTDKLGINIDDIKTTEDFKQMLIKIRDGDPNENGKKDELPLTSYSSLRGWFSYLMNPFVYAGDKNFMVVNDGELSFAYDTDEWKEGLKYIKGLYDEGLINSLIFSQDKAAYTSLLNHADTVVGAFCDYGPDLIDAADKRRVEYEGVQPLENKDGVPIATYRPAAPAIRFLVSKNAANPEVVFRFGDLKASEEFSVHTRWGLKGTDWLEPKDTDKSMYETLGYKPYLIEVLGWSILQNQNWAQAGPYIRQKAISAGVVWSGNPLDHNIVIAKAQLKYEGKNPDEVITKLIFNEEEEEVATERLSALNSYVVEMIASFVTGAVDIDAGWDDYLDQLEAIGTAEVLTAAQSSYDRMYK